MREQALVAVLLAAALSFSFLPLAGSAEGAQNAGADEMETEPSFFGLEELPGLGKIFEGIAKVLSRLPLIERFFRIERAVQHKGQGKELSRSFEFRYFDNSAGSNSETDFKGSSGVFSTDERVEFLHSYAEYASRFFNDPDLDREAITDGDVEEALSKLKAQPLPEVGGRCKALRERCGPDRRVA